MIYKPIFSDYKNKEDLTMQIKEITLHQLKGFKCAQIKTLVLRCTQDIQLILGTIGMGKSSLLAQLSPLPPKSTSFGPEGYKELLIEHHGNNYKLVSDFAKKGYAHEFWFNGINLNESGTTEVQKELVLSHFNWTKETSDLCFNKLLFTHMGPSVRQLFFTNLNPNQIAFVLEKNKKVKSFISSTKSILSNLMERKVAIEQDLLKEENIKALEGENESLSQKSNQLSKLIYAVQMHTQPSLEKPQDVSILLEKIDRHITQVNKENNRIWNIPRDNLENYQRELENKLVTLRDYQLPEIESQAKVLASKTEENQRELQKLSIGETKEELECEIISLEEKLKTIESIKVERPFNEKFISTSELWLNELFQLLQLFSQYEGKVYSRKRIKIKMKHFDKWNYQFQNYLSHLERLVEEKETLEKKKSKDFVCVPENCQKEVCSLYISHMSSMNQIEGKLALYKEDIERIEKKKDRLENWLTHQKYQLDQLSSLMENLNKLQEFTKRYPDLYPFLTTSDVLKKITQTPFSLYHEIKNHLSISIQQLEIPNLKNLLVEKRTTLKSVKNRSEELINEKKTLISQLEIELLDKTSKMERIKKDISFLEKQHHDCTTLLNHKKKLLEYEIELENALQKQKEYFEYSTLKDIEKSLQSQQTEVQKRLGEISIILTKQKGLQDRYENEILGQINEKELLLKDLTLISKSLNIIPMKSMTKFLNKIIKETNKRISQIISYDFYLKPIEENDLNYNFPYMAKGAESPDIQECSDGQKDIVNLCLTLVCRKIMGMSAYPLFLDELGRAFDTGHQRRLVDLLLYILDEKKATQIFLVSHHAIIHEGLSNVETLVLHDSDVMKPSVYNTHVEITEL